MMNPSIFSHAGLYLLCSLRPLHYCVPTCQRYAPHLLAVLAISHVPCCLLGMR